MSSFHDLMKYAATGIGPDLSAYDKQKALSMFGGSSFPVSTLSGIPPISFLSDGSDLSAWSITGASDGVGDRTANLFNASTALHNYYISDTDGVAKVAVNNDCSDYIEIKPETNYYITSIPSGRWGAWYDENKQFISGITIYGVKKSPAGAKYMRVTVNRNNNNTDFANTFMVIEGTAEPESYVPYGYEIPITCNSVTQTVYLDEPIGNGESVSMASTGITIATVNGSNTLSIGTTVQPSAVSITGHVKEIASK